MLHRQNQEDAASESAQTLRKEIFLRDETAIPPNYAQIRPLAQIPLSTLCSMFPFASTVPPEPIQGRSRSLEPEQQIYLLLGILALLGVGLAQTVSALEMDLPTSRRSDMFHYLFATYDQWHLIFLAAFSGLLCLGFRSAVPSGTGGLALTRGRLWMLAIAIVIAGCLGTHFICQNYPFAMDEYYADFQAAIFAQGKLFAPIAPDVAPIGAAASPLLVNFNPATQTWTSNYLPVYALLRTPFWMAGCSWLFNPLLAGLTIFALHGVICRLWPAQTELRWVGLLLLVSNVQFLITSMTAYAMPAHLLVNLVWLWLYLDPSPKRQLLAPLLGVLAMGLHQPNVHLVFAFPFCCKLLLDRRWKMAAWHALIYAAGIWLWLTFSAWKAVPAIAGSAPALSTTGYLVKTFFTRLPNILQYLDLGIGLAKVLAWSPLALLFLAAAAVLNWKKLGSIQICLLAGVFLALFLCLLFPLNQGHGWGNRYLFPYLGNLILLAVSGFQEMERKALGRDLLRVSSIVSLCLVLPARAWEVHREITPFAEVSKELNSLPQKVVVIDTESIWYGQDLVRNAPGLTNSPKLLFMKRYNADVDAWCRSHPPSGSMGYKLLKRFGMKARHNSPPVQKP